MVQVEVVSANKHADLIGNLPSPTAKSPDASAPNGELFRGLAPFLTYKGGVGFFPTDTVLCCSGVCHKVFGVGVCVIFLP